MTKRRVWLVVLIAILVALGAVACIVYANAGTMTTFPQNTRINGLDCSNMTVAQAEKKLTNEYNNKSYVVIQDGQKKSITNLGLKYDIKDQLEKAMRFANIKSGTGIFASDINESVTMKASKQSKDLVAGLKALGLEGSSIRKTRDAYINMDDDNYPIVPEVYGNNVDFKKLATKVMEDIGNDVWEISYVPKDYYKLPKVTKDDSSLLEKQEYCKKYLTQKIVYDLGGKQYQISGKYLDKMLKVGDDGKVTVNKKQVKKFVNMLAKRCNTLGQVRKFKSTLRGDINVGGGTFGRLLDNKKETKKLIKNLLSGKDVKRKPIYSVNCVSSDGLSVGKTYVEVDLGNQHFWFYQNGKVVIESDVVSGNVSTGRSTATGVFYVIYKQRDVTLKGRNEDGTKYESDVSYWMPFYMDLGLHDASWRGKFGGDIYKYDGSHGCVNLPVGVAAKLYENVFPGCPVVVYY